MEEATVYEPIELAALEVIAELEAALVELRKVRSALADPSVGGGKGGHPAKGVVHFPGGGNAPDWGDYWLYWERANREKNNRPGAPTSVPPWFTITDPGAQIIFTDLGGPGWTWFGPGGGG